MLFLANRPKLIPSVFSKFAWEQKAVSWEQPQPIDLPDTILPVRLIQGDSRVLCDIYVASSRHFFVSNAISTEHYQYLAHRTYLLRGSIRVYVATCQFYSINSN